MSEGKKDIIRQSVEAEEEVKSVWAAQFMYSMLTLVFSDSLLEHRLKAHVGFACAVCSSWP